MSGRTVKCQKLGEELPALPFKPFPNEFGQMLFDHVSMQAWQMWLRESPRYINTYRFDLQNPADQEKLQGIMKTFFGFDGGEELPDTAWKPPE